jgi:hypothetical protein
MDPADGVKLVAFYFYCCGHDFPPIVSLGFGFLVAGIIAVLSIPVLIVVAVFAEPFCYLQAYFD